MYMCSSNIFNLVDIFIFTLSVADALNKPSTNVTYVYVL